MYASDKDFTYSYDMTLTFDKQTPPKAFCGLSIGQNR